MTGRLITKRLITGRFIAVYVMTACWLVGARIALGGKVWFALR